MGIGLIVNKLATDRKYNVQADINCNRYIYIGNYHLTRDQLANDNPALLYLLDKVLFTGYTHSKRGIGLTKLPKKVLELTASQGMHIPKEIRAMFLSKCQKRSQESSASVSMV